MNGWNGGETIVLATRITCPQENVRAYISVEITHYTYRGPGGLMLLKAHRPSGSSLLGRSVFFKVEVKASRELVAPVGLGRWTDGQIMILL